MERDSSSIPMITISPEAVPGRWYSRSCAQRSTRWILPAAIRIVTRSAPSKGYRYFLILSKMLHPLPGSMRFPGLPSDGGHDPRLPPGVASGMCGTRLQLYCMGKSEQNQAHGKKCSGNRRAVRAAALVFVPARAYNAFCMRCPGAGAQQERRMDHGLYNSAGGQECQQ